MLTALNHYLADDRNPKAKAVKVGKGVGGMFNPTLRIRKVRFKKQVSWLLCTSLAMLVVGCGGGDSDGAVGTGFGDPADSVKPFTISGAAQKGPFIKGTRVLINRLTSLAEGTYETTVGEIDDNLGNFRFTYNGTGPVLIEADGVHFNEVTGQLSNSQLRLRAIYNVNNNPEQHAYINVLTHLAYGRIQKLIRSGTPIDDAIKQGEAAVIESLRPVLPVADVVDFTELSLFNTDAARAVSNAYLLALSATVSQYAIEKQKANQGSPVESELTYLLDNLSYSIAEVGRIDSSDVIRNLKAAAKMLRPDQIKANLAKRAVDATHLELPVADIDLFIDTDGDGIVNSEDADDDNDGMPDAVDATPYVFTRAPSLSKPSDASAVPSIQDVTFEWSSTEPIAQAEMQVSTNESFVGDVRMLKGVGAAVTTRFDLAGEYYLKSRAKNALGTWGDWGAIVKITVGKFESAIGSYDVFSGQSNYLSGLTPMPDGGMLVSSSTSTRGLSAHGGLTKLDGQGKVVWSRSVDAVGSLGYKEQILRLNDGTTVFPGVFDPQSGRKAFTVVDNEGLSPRTVSVDIGQFTSYSVSNSVLSNGTILFVFLGTNCSYPWYWFQCSPISPAPTLVRLDPATGEVEFKPISGFGDLSLGGATYKSGPYASLFPSFFEPLPPHGLPEKVSPWDYIVALNKVGGDQLLLTFLTRFESNCANIVCKRTGLATLNSAGVVNWVWQSDLLSDIHPLISVAAHEGRVFLAERVVDGANGSYSNYLYSVNLADQTVMTYPDAEEFDWFKSPDFTRSGRILVWPSVVPSFGPINYLLEFDIENKKASRVDIPCRSNELCSLSAFSSTPDGGLIFGISGWDGDAVAGSSRIVKWMDADKGR